jgi:hypothetical protein
MERFIPKDATDVIMAACLEGYCVIFTHNNQQFLKTFPVVIYQVNIPYKQNLYVETFTINLN